MRERSLAEVWPGSLHASFFFAFFGLPIAYFVTAALVLVARARGGSPAAMSPGKVVATGTVAGLVTFSFPAAWSLSDLTFLAPVGAYLGGGASAVFVLIRASAPPSQSAS
ncbi:MAG: hypothetical protein KF709_12900 [Gemmatimonadaceae bacterium]|nr:hypothetical protein [Gemmatimonadaceae bacterium]